MPDDLLALADRLYTGELPIEEHHPFRGAGELAEVQPGTAFVQAFANSAVFATPDGLVVVDTSGVFHAALVHTSVRNWSDARLDTAIFTHGHIDHVFGVDRYEEEARANGWRAAARDRARAHRAALRALRAHRGLQRGHQPAPVRHAVAQWPVDYRYPDVTYRDVLSIDVGGERFELRHDRGETDDGTWVWVPGAARAVHRRPVRLGVAELRQPAEGAALRGRLGRRDAKDEPRSTQRCSCPDTACRSWAPTGSGARCSTRRRCSNRCSSRPSR